MRRRIFVLILSILMLLSVAGCGNDKNYISKPSAAVNGYKAFGKTGSLQPEDSSLTGLKLVSENDYLGLYYDEETCVVTVYDKRSGKSYTTAPKDQADGKNKYMAALNLVYGNIQGKTGTLDSYTQSVSLNQVEIETSGSSVTFVYRIGDISDGLEVTPSIIGDKYFQELLEKADSSQKKVLERRYSYVKDYDAWTRRKLKSDAAISQLVEVFKDLGYTSEDLVRDNKENNVSAASDEKLAFTVPLRFTLDEDSVIADIDMNKVEYPENNPLIQIEFLQYFGAVTAEQQGYFLLPDGSGAIMPFKSVESGAVGYQASVYGDDRALRVKSRSTESQDALMPIYGANYYDSGFLAVIEDGEALADILAYNSGSADQYGKIYSRVNFLKTESTSLGENSGDDNFNFYNFQKEPYNGKYAVRYIFLENGSSDYNKMAAAYRNYLLTTGSLNKKVDDGAAPILIETVGGVLSTKSFLGFQYQGITALTKYEDNLKMVEELSSEGVENIKLKLTGFSGDGLQNVRSNKVKLIGALGSNKEFKQLIEGSNGEFTVYPDFNYLTFSSNSGLIAKNSYAVKSLDLKAAKIEITNYVTLNKNTQINDNLYYLNAISSLESLNQGIVKFLDKYSFKNMSIADMGSSASSDFSPAASYDRQSSINTTSEIIKQLSESYGLMLSAANSKNIGYAEYVSDAPLWSSQYDFAEGIPFYSMVYYGSVVYTGSSLNLSSDPQREFLKCIEYGAQLKYTLAYRNIDSISKSDYSELYSVDFENNSKDIAENYKAVNELYKKTADATVTVHKRLAPSVYYTEYSNGVYTVVNYSGNDYASEYGTVPAEAYIIG